MILLLPLSAISVRSRQRKKIDANSLADLRNSILSPTGLLHPPVCRYDSATKTWVLVAGERRLTAIQQIAKDGLSFTYGRETIAPGTIPITPLDDAITALDCFSAELDENLHREDLPWQDKVEALNALHQMRKELNPAQSFKETGTEISGPNKAITNPDWGGQIVRQAVLVSPHLTDPTIFKARNANEALSLILKREEEKALAALAKHYNLKTSPETSSIEIHHADLSQLLPSLSASQFDLVIADPPYGIDAGNPGARARTIHHHNYADDPQIAREIAQDILREGFRLTKPRANLFLFCDIDLFPWLKITAANCGWVPFRRPLIWHKSETEGLFPWGSQGPRITTEFILYATKGQKGLIVSPTDVLDVKRVSRNVRTHGAEKPVELFTRLIECSTVVGERILDPCCGSGASLIAARNLNRRASGIELNDVYYNTAMANCFGAEVMSQPEIETLS